MTGKWKYSAAPLSLSLLVWLSAPASAQSREARYVSTSGIPHHDVGNYTKSEFWESGDPRGMPDHPTWRPSIDNVLTRIKSENPNKVLHTGDMVSGKWGVDVDRTGIFGPVGT